MISLMANCFSWIKRRREPWKKVTILMVGLDNAGKTSTVADLTGESTEGITPTVGFLNSSFSLYRFHVTLFDLGGGSRIRSIWKNYYAETFGIVYVVDASDLDRLVECKKVLHETEMQPQVSGKPLLILGNKQDCPEALNEDQLYKQLGLNELVEKHRCPCRVFCCTAVLGKANKVDRQIKKGFRWLLSEVSNDFANLSRRVEKDMIEQKQLQDEERERRKERVRLAREAREKAEREAAEKEQEKEEESDDGVVVSKDKKKKERVTPEPKTSNKNKKERETPEPEVPEKKKKKKKKKQKSEGHEVDAPSATQGRDGDSPTEPQLKKHENPSYQEELSTVNTRNVSMLNGTLAQSEDTEVKKKKKKKKRKNNKTAPTEGEGDGDGQFELPPLAWGTPPGTLNGFPGSGGGTPRRLEPLGPPRLGGTRQPGTSSIPEDDEGENSVPSLRVASWPNSRPNSEDCDLVT